MAVDNQEWQAAQDKDLTLARVKSVINLLFAAYTGDVSALRRKLYYIHYFNSCHGEVVRFLLEACKVNPVPKDR
ncbi:hypothetical protein CRUP_015076 [Coryphaenoides rupestris]|nr:hypothetical protein CRUP_015076 [Coryphaenoides rupestris]